MPSTGPTPQPIKPDFNKAAKAMSKTQTPKLQGQQRVQARGQDDGPGSSSQSPSLPSYSGPNLQAMTPGNVSPPPLAGIPVPAVGKVQPTEPGQGAYAVVDPRKTPSQSLGNQVETGRRFYR